MRYNEWFKLVKNDNRLIYICSNICYNLEYNHDFGITTFKFKKKWMINFFIKHSNHVMQTSKRNYYNYCPIITRCTIEHWNDHNT